MKSPVAELICLAAVFAAVAGAPLYFTLTVFALGTLLEIGVHLPE